MTGNSRLGKENSKTILYATFGIYCLLCIVLPRPEVRADRLPEQIGVTSTRASPEDPYL